MVSTDKVIVKAQRREQINGGHWTESQSLLVVSSSGYFFPGCWDCRAAKPNAHNLISTFWESLREFTASLLTDHGADCYGCAARGALGTSLPSNPLKPSLLLRGLCPSLFLVWILSILSWTYIICKWNKPQFFPFTFTRSNLFNCVYDGVIIIKVMMTTTIIRIIA